MGVGCTLSAGLLSPCTPQCAWQFLAQGLVLVTLVGPVPKMLSLLTVEEEMICNLSSFAHVQQHFWVSGEVLKIKC